MRTRPAFSYLELAVVATVIGIFLIVAIPDEDGASKEQGRQFCQKFEADAAYARSLTIAHPGDPVVIKVDGASNRYWLAQASAPDVPIAHPWTGRPYEVQCGPEGDGGMEYVAIVGVDFDGDEVLGFDAMGSTDQEGSALVQVNSGGAAFEVSVSAVEAASEVRSAHTKDLGQTAGAIVFDPPSGGTMQSGGSQTLN